jgi:hypothetical protein
MFTNRFRLIDPRAPRLVNARLSCVMILVCAVGSLASADAAEFSTANFRVMASRAAIARDVALRAEELRAGVALDWLGRELAPWSERCKIVVNTDSRKLVGDTTYVLDRGEMRRCRMDLRGDPQRILDVLLTHEVVHTVLASHFQCAIPRWADEGAALSAEDVREQNRLWKLEAPRLAAGDHLPLRVLFDAREYPENRDEIRRFYVQGGSLTEFLLLAGKPRFISFLTSGMQDGWDAAVEQHYGFAGVATLESAWQAWIAQDRPRIPVATEQLLMTAFAPSLGSPLVPRSVTGDATTRVVARDVQIAGGAGGGQ